MTQLKVPLLPLHNPQLLEGILECSLRHRDVLGGQNIVNLDLLTQFFLEALEAVVTIQQLFLLVKQSNLAGKVYKLSEAALLCVELHPSFYLLVDFIHVQALKSVQNDFSAGGVKLANLLQDAHKGIVVPISI